MRRQNPIQALVYNTLFPDPTPQDPQDFSQFLIRYLILEVRVETHRFYGNLDTTEAKYPGLNYAHAPHRRRLGRFPHHARLFRAFDALGLTTYEIAELCKWEGTLWARQRYEREEGIRVEDTTGSEIPRWKGRDLHYRRGGNRAGRPTSPALGGGRSASPRERRVSHADNRRERSEGCTSPTIGGRKRKRIVGGGGLGISGGEGQDVGLVRSNEFCETRATRGFRSEIEEEILNVYRQRPVPFGVLNTLYHPQQLTAARRPSLNLNTAVSTIDHPITNVNGTDHTLFYGTSTNACSGRRSSMTTGVHFLRPSQSLIHGQGMIHEEQKADIVSGMGNGSVMNLGINNLPDTTDPSTTSSESGSGSSNSITPTFIHMSSNSPPQLTMDEETASETASIITDDMHGMTTTMESVGSGADTPPVRIGIGMLGDSYANGNAGGRMSVLPTPPTSAPREVLREMMSPPTTMMVPAEGSSGMGGKVEGQQQQTGLPSPVASDGDAEML